MLTLLTELGVLLIHHNFVLKGAATVEDTYPFFVYFTALDEETICSTVVNNFLFSSAAKGKQVI